MSLKNGCAVIDQISPGCLNIILEISHSSSLNSNKWTFFYDIINIYGNIIKCVYKCDKMVICCFEMITSNY